jgi:glutamate/tyrosine decarboxylase-like PLP-dependent enzyme
MQDDIIQKCLSLLNGDANMAGIVTCGGTESIFLAVRAARAEARFKRGLPKGTGHIVLPETAHPAFSKAAQSMDLEERRIPVLPDGRADVEAMSLAMDAETVMLVGSAPCFPYGVIDPIRELGELALAKGAWLHTDACVGGYLAPFVRDSGYPIPDFDLSVPGVASLSADLHKYGFCPKPSSTVFFSNSDRCALAGFDLDVWPSGRFVTSTLVGTRPAGGVAGAWATLHFLGAEGYRRIAQRIMTMRDDYIAGITAIPGYRMIAKPDLALLAFTNPSLDMGRVAALMLERGWLPGMTAQPPGLHMMLSLLHEPVRDQYLSDLNDCSTIVRRQMAAGESGLRESAKY